MPGTSVAYDIIARDRASRAFQQVASNAAASQKKIEKVGQSLRSAGHAITRSVTLPVVAAGAASIKLATDFNASMQRVNGLAGESQKTVDQWSKKVLAMAKVFPQGPQELADALQFIASSGITGQRALDALRASAKAAAAGLGDTQTVADAVTSAMNAYGKKNITAAKATDILTQAVKDGKAEADTLAPVMGRVIPIASQMGVSFDQVAASIASMSLSGMDAAEAATSTQAFLSGLLKPSAAGAKALKGVGLSFEGLRKELKTKGLLATMQTLKTSFKGNDDQLAKVVPNVRALRGMLALVGKNGKRTSEVFADLKKSTGATDEAFKSASKTAEFKFKRALSSLQSDAISFGNKALPVAEKALSKVMDAMDKFNSMPKPFKVAALGAVGFVAALGPVLTVAGNLVRAYGGVVKVLHLMREASIGTRIQLAALRVQTLAVAAAQKIAAAAAKVWAVGQRLLNLAMKANPIGIVITAVAALVAGLILAYKHSATFRKIVNGAFHAVADAAKWMWEKVIKPVFRLMVSVWFSVAGAIVNGAAKAFGWVPGIGDKLKKAASWFNDFRDRVNRSLSGVHNHLSITVDTAQARSAIKGLKTYMDSIPKVTTKTLRVASYYSKRAGIPHRAAGGPVRAGNPYVVGEHRPELFVPETNGRIVPKVPERAGNVTNITVEDRSGDPRRTAQEVARRFVFAGGA